MIPLLAAVSLSPAAPYGAGLQTTAVRLVRGAEVPLAPGLPRYFDVGEAVLDSKESDVAQPLEYAALVGSGRSMLLKFGSLDAVLPPGAKIESATLRLTSVESQPIKITSVRRVLVPWRAAGPSVLSARLRKDQPVVPRQSASWNVRRFGQKWSRAGAQSEFDSVPITSASIGTDGTVTGLVETVQTMADRWWENQGFLIGFDAESLVGSSLSPTGRPELTIEYSVATPASGGADLSAIGRAGEAVQVANLGSAPSAGYRVRANVDGKPGEWSAAQPALAPGAKAEVALPKAIGGNPGTRVVLEVEGQDANPRNDAVETILGGKTVSAPSAEKAAALSRAVRLWNAAAETSRFGFAPDGPIARLTYAGVGESALPDAETAAIFPALSLAAGIPETASTNLDASAMPAIPNAPRRGAADRFAGLSGGGDTRSEAAITIQTDLANEPYDDPMIRRLALEPTGALSLYDVAALNPAGPPPLPRAAAVLLRNASGRPLLNQEIRVYKGDAGGFSAEPVATLISGPTGLVVLSDKVLGPKLLALVATANGETEVGFLKDAQLRASAARGNIAPVIGVRLNLPTLPINRESSLSSGKFVNDSLSSPASVLGLAVDGDGATPLKMVYPANGFIEIDLGRDRTVGEVAIRATTLPRRFDLRLRNTGEEASASLLWATEGDWPWTRANRPDAVAGGSGVLYRGTAQRGRYLRIVFPEGGEVALNEVLVYASQISG